MPATIARHDKVPGRGHLHDHHHRVMCSEVLHGAEDSTHARTHATHVSSRFPAAGRRAGRKARRSAEPHGDCDKRGMPKRRFQQLFKSENVFLASLVATAAKRTGYSSEPAFSSSLPGMRLSMRCLRLASYSSRVTTSSMRRLMPATSRPVMAPRRSVTRSFTSSKMAGA